MINEFIRFTNSLAPSADVAVRNDMRMYEGVVGSAISFASIEPSTLALTPTIVSAPGGSVASFSGQSFTPDAIGVYTLSFARTGFQPILVVVRVFLAAVWTRPEVSALGVNSRVALLRGIANNPGVSDAAFAAATAASPWPAGSQPQVQAVRVVQ